MKRFSMVFCVSCCLIVMSCKQGASAPLQERLRDLSDVESVQFNFGRWDMKPLSDRSSLDRAGRKIRSLKGGDIETNLPVLQGKVLTKGLEVGSVNPAPIKSSPVSPPSQSASPKSSQARIPTSVEDAYDKLERRLMHYRADALSRRDHLYLEINPIKASFENVSKKFMSQGQTPDFYNALADVYNALGYNFAAVKNLLKALEKLDIKDLYYSSTDNRSPVMVACENLFVLMRQFGNYTNKIIDIHLSSSNLGRIKAKGSEDDIKALSACLDEFIQAREDASLKIQSSIESLLMSKDKQDALKRIREIVGLEKGVHGEVQNASYLIVNFEARIKDLLYKI
ncbi:hypothetical protein bcCo53_001151 (plasmid) [Borrelia coriaceae]|nr:hypothetical protein [Borrelia coriaceae]UPA16983.1 hypothetical protein bcCo53_001151 [Borrelia coriaceae]